jgi:hypothetical protein
VYTSGEHIIPGEIRSGAVLMCSPEVYTTYKAVIDSRSSTPSFKRVPVLVRAGRGVGLTELQ